LSVRLQVQFKSSEYYVLTDGINDLNCKEKVIIFDRNFP